jgi:hypothetical protein
MSTVDASFNPSKPDLFFYGSALDPTTKVYNLLRVDDLRVQIVKLNIYSSKLGKDEEKLGFAILEKTYTDASGETVNFRVAQANAFFDEKLSKINGGLSWQAPNLAITNIGNQSPGTQIIYTLLPGTGNFLNSTGYIVITAFPEFSLFEVFFTNL